MQKAKGGIVGVVLLLLSVFFGGCAGTAKMPLQNDWSNIIVGQSRAADVVNLLSNRVSLQRDNSISAFHKKGWSRELMMVVFGENDSRTIRKDYILRRSGFMKEKIYLQIQTLVPSEVLNNPYETALEKNIAILNYGLKSLIDDARPYNNDRETVALVGLARSGLERGIYYLGRRPREAYKLGEEAGFDFQHGTLQKCRLQLKNADKNIYMIKLWTNATVDPLTSF